jgi:hypothetical protein
LAFLDVARLFMRRGSEKLYVLLVNEDEEVLDDFVRDRFWTEANEKMAAAKPQRIKATIIQIIDLPLASVSRRL